MTHSPLYLKTLQTGYHSNGHSLWCVKSLALTRQANQSIRHFMLLTSPPPLQTSFCQTWRNIPLLTAAHSEDICLWSVSWVNTAIEVKPKVAQMLKTLSRFRHGGDKRNKVLCQAKWPQQWQNKQTLGPFLQEEEDFAFHRRPSHVSGVHWSQMHFVHLGKPCI